MADLEQTGRFLGGSGGILLIILGGFMILDINYQLLFYFSYPFSILGLGGGGGNPLLAGLVLVVLGSIALLAFAFYPRLKEKDSQRKSKGTAGALFIFTILLIVVSLMWAATFMWGQLLVILGSILLLFD
ncbi:MAG: hypothetical protein ACXAC8_02230 [Candidatus Hodarchaeales archaeon]